MLAKFLARATGSRAADYDNAPALSGWSAARSAELHRNARRAAARLDDCTAGMIARTSAGLGL